MQQNPTIWLNVVVKDEEVDLATFPVLRNKFGSQAYTAQVIGLNDEMIISKFERGKSKIDKRTYSLFLLASDNHPIYRLVLKNEAQSEQLAITPPDGEGIRLVRENAGITQGYMAFVLGIMSKDKPNRQLISRYEQNVQSPSSQTWSLFLLSVGMHPNYEIFPKLID